MREAIDRSRIDANIDVIRDGQAATRYFDAAENDEHAPDLDLILLDLNLPKTSGDELLKRLRASARWKAAKVLTVSSSDSLQDRSTAERLAVAAYFKKPSTFAEFMQLGPIVERLLKKDPA